MKIQAKRDELRIVPETEQDLAFLEDTLGLIKDGDAVPLKMTVTKGLELPTTYLSAKKESDDVSTE